MQHFAGLDTRLSGFAQGDPGGCVTTHRDLWIERVQLQHQKEPDPCQLSRNDQAGQPAPCR